MYIEHLIEATFFSLEIEAEVQFEYIFTARCLFAFYRNLYSRLYQFSSFIRKMALYVPKIY